MLNKIIFINLILILNFNFYPMQMNRKKLSVKIKNRIKKNSIFDPLNGIKKIIKKNNGLQLKNYFLNIADFFTKKYFAKKELGYNNRIKKRKLVKIFQKKDSYKNQVKAARLIIAGINDEIFIKINDFKLSPLLFIVHTNKFHNLIKLLIKNKINIDAKDHNGKTFLMWCFFNNRQDIIDSLLRKNPDVNTQDNNGMTLIMHLIKLDKIEMIDKLLSKINYIDIYKIKDDLGKTALNYAYESQNKKIFLKLLKYSGLILNIQKFGYTINIMYLNPENYKEVLILNLY